MDTIRVQRNEKRVTVNERGDYIIFRPGDPGFIDALMSLGEEFQNFVSENSSRLEEAKADTSDENRVTRVAVKLNLEMSQLAAEKINALFGPDACMKIFGTETPSDALLTDFFEQATPLMQQYAAEESARSQERIRKYTERYKK